MGGNQSQQAYSMGGSMLPETQPQQWQPQEQPGGNPYPSMQFEDYMNLLYEDLKTKAAYDPANAGYDTASGDQGFSF